MPFMSLDFTLSPIHLNGPTDTHTTAHAVEVDASGDSGSINWETAWIDIGGEG
jgi:hypothetical protein